MALALIGTVAGAVGLGVGQVGRGADARREAELLAARMRRGTEEAILTGQPVALAWTERDYRFLVLADGAWVPHPVPVLGQPKPLDGGVRFEGDAAAGGAFAVTAAALPAAGTPLVLALGTEGGDPGRAVVVVWDGAAATLTEPEE